MKLEKLVVKVLHGLYKSSCELNGSRSLIISGQE